MKKVLLTFAALAAFSAVNAQQTYNYFDPADCDADGWLWFNTQEKLDKYVGWGDPFDTTKNPKIMLQAAEHGDYAEPTLDPTLQGYNADRVQGGEGSWTGGIILPGSSTANGSDNPNGAGILLQLPDCAYFGLKLSTESEYICVGLKGGKGWLEGVDLALIQTYLRMGAFVNRPLASVPQFTWENIQNVENANTNLKLASPLGEKVTAQVRNNRGDDLYVQGIKILTYTDNGYAGGSGVAGIEADENAHVEFFNMQGMKVSGNEPGMYIRRQGSKTAKVIVK